MTSVKSIISKAGLLTGGSIIHRTLADRVVDAFDDDIVQTGLVVDVCNFSLSRIQINSIPHRRRAGRPGILQDCGTHFGSCLIAGKLLSKVGDNLRV